MLCSQSCFLFRPELNLHARKEYLAQAIINSHTNSVGMGGSGEFQHELKEKMDVARIQLMIYTQLSERRGTQDALIKLDSQLLPIDVVSPIRINLSI